MNSQESLKGEAGYSKEISKKQISPDIAARANLSCSGTKGKGTNSPPSRSPWMTY